MTCILCPRGCTINLTYDPGSMDISDISGAGCRKGLPWARQELLAPVRTLCTSILVDNGEDPLVSVKSDREIPLEKIPEVMNEIAKTRVSAPVGMGDVILEYPAGTDCRIIATRRTEIKQMR